MLGNLAVGHDGGQFLHVQLMVNGSFTADASKGNAPTNASRRCAHIGLNPPNNQAAGSMPINFLHDHDSTSAQTYHFRFSHTSGSTRNVYLNYGGSTGNSAENGRYILYSYTLGDKRIMEYDHPAIFKAYPGAPQIVDGVAAYKSDGVKLLVQSEIDATQLH